MLSTSSSSFSIIFINLRPLILRRRCTHFPFKNGLGFCLAMACHQESTKYSHKYSHTYSMYTQARLANKIRKKTYFICFMQILITKMFIYWHGVCVCVCVCVCVYLFIIYTCMHNFVREMYTHAHI